MRSKAKQYLGARNDDGPFLELGRRALDLRAHSHPHQASVMQQPASTPASSKRGTDMRKDKTSNGEQRRRTILPPAASTIAPMVSGGGFTDGEQ
jgi:hypothetical protein